MDHNDITAGITTAFQSDRTNCLIAAPLSSTPSRIEQVLPEIWSHIAEDLSREDLKNLSMCSRALKSAMSPVLFSKLVIDLFDDDWAHRALSAVRPDTWRHVRALTVNIDYLEGHMELEQEEYLQHLHLRSLYFRQLPCLRHVKLVFESWLYRNPLQGEFSSQVQRLVQSSCWVSHVECIKSLARHNSTHAETTLHMELPRLDVMSFGISDMWRRITAPSHVFKPAVMQLHMTIDDDESSPVDLSTLTACFPADWVKGWTMVTYGRDLSHATAFQNVTNISLEFCYQAIPENFGYALASLSMGLEELHLRSMPFRTQDSLHLPKRLQRLKRISAGGGPYISTLHEVVRRVDLPELTCVEVLMSDKDDRFHERDLRILAHQFEV